MYLAKLNKLFEPFEETVNFFETLCVIFQINDYISKMFYVKDCIFMILYGKNFLQSNNIKFSIFLPKNRPCCVTLTILKIVHPKKLKANDQSVLCASRGVQC